MGGTNREPTLWSNSGDKALALENLCLKGGLRIVFLWDILKSVVKKDTQTNKM